MIRRPPRSTQSRSSAASDVYKRQVYAMTFSGFYLAIMLVLFGLILRAVSLEFRHGDQSWSRVWDGAFFLGSLAPATLVGCALGNVIRGVPMNANGDYTGTFLQLLNPYSLLVAVTGLFLIVTHLSLIHISEPTRLGLISYAVFCLKKK